MHQQTLYLFLPHAPRGPVLARGLKNAAKLIRMVGNNAPLRGRTLMKLDWSPVPVMLSTDFPEGVRMSG